MKNIAPKLTPTEYEDNFSELHPAFDKNQAVTESNRCLYCYDSPCMKACPTHIDISTFIKKIATGNMKGSAKTIFESNWIALTCAKACPVDVLCEGACVYNERGEKPIEIGRLQRYAIDTYFSNGMQPLFTPKPKNGKSVGIIGGGPSGLACSAELALMGYDVTVYESKSVPGGLDTWGIAPYKMKFQDSLNEVKLIESFGVKIKTGMRIGTNVTISELEKQHDAIYLGVGLGISPDLNIPGEDLNGVHDALEFIEKVTTRKWSSVDVGKRVAVIGAGNTAIDAATEAKRLGAEHVMIVYRRGEEDMSAYEFEYELAKSDGITFYFNTAPKRLIGNGTVDALECVRMTTGQKSLQAIPGSEFQIPVDMVIKSIGQMANKDLLAGIPNLKIENGKVVVNPDTHQTSHSKYFAGGDCINGGKEVVNAAADGKRAAHGIDKFLFSK
ncbi:MAG TPA: NAD(P)-dependent oxidoreductase [Bacteroidota bacterium]|jgi:glutamate synthase (NADPH/NADH) small chain|nr:NAD(P)-dependent oxidoreductase [Bacteroidota bacterium]